MVRSSTPQTGFQRLSQAWAALFIQATESTPSIRGDGTISLPALDLRTRPTQRLVIRGNYGIFYDQPVLKAFGDSNPPNRGATGVLANPGSVAPVYTVSRANYTIVPGQSIFGSVGAPPPPYGLFSVSQDFKNAYNQNFGLNMQYQLNKSTVFQVGYSASLGRRLLMMRDINQPPPSPLGASASLALQNTLRPYYAAFPQFATINQVESVGNSSYNSLAGKLANQFVARIDRSILVHLRSFDRYELGYS